MNDGIASLVNWVRATTSQAKADSKLEVDSNKLATRRPRDTPQANHLQAGPAGRKLLPYWGPQPVKYAHLLSSINMQQALNFECLCVPMCMQNFSVVGLRASRTNYLNLSSEKAQTEMLIQLIALASGEEGARRYPVSSGHMICRPACIAYFGISSSNVKRAEELSAAQNHAGRHIEPQQRSAVYVSGAPRKSRQGSHANLSPSSCHCHGAFSRESSYDLAASNGQHLL